MCHLLWKLNEEHILGFHPIAVMEMIFMSTFFPFLPDLHTMYIHSSCMSDPLPEIERQVQALRERFLQDAPPVSYHWCVPLVCGG